MLKFLKHPSTADTVAALPESEASNRRRPEEYWNPNFSTALNLPTSFVADSPSVESESPTKIA